ncbi:MAG: alanine--tRNA ligase [Ilumatobacter sp.]|uniref:alanine--tRNA ligase n=1 Tax=Ilumatobacter sp. TaxID=1967498 RepID=UPI00261BD8E7|nr:alanine--tRNA ligase [Ilumatobacter sp.]MDJ0769904.1 alanine--tRNA ligase [Ilumatobacter sp.]
MTNGNHSITADGLRQSFVDFFAAKDHTVVPSASLIPHDPTVMFTVAGMVPFKPYFVGDEVPPYARAVSSQKCARAGGKHNDLDDVGRTKRHLVFFEMMGNFSFGDYFKEAIIPWSWDLVTGDPASGGWGLDGDRMWITVHESDDEAEQMWHELVGVPMERIQRLGDKDNFWQMGDTGPCGPCSEIHIDRGPEFGPDGGPLGDPAGDRFMEFWNLVFMQYNQTADGTRTPLPKPSVDTGAGLERILALLQGVDSVWETDLMLPLIETAQSLTGKSYTVGDYGDRDSFAMRVLAEHARSSTMLVSDGVFPSNEGRGYVLRRILRRAVRYAFLLGTDQLVMPRLVEMSIDIMGNAYPDVVKNRDFIVGVLTREEERFRHTLKTGLGILDDELGEGASLPGSTAFLLHDTYGFPLELTQEIAGERDVEVDLDGFQAEMTAQRERAKAARKDSGGDDGQLDGYREVVEQFGVTEFLGYTDDETQSRVLAVLPGGTDDDGNELSHVFLDRTPFYAESGGQIGDTGTIVTETGTAEVVDTTFALPNLRRHLARVTSGSVSAGQQATATIDADRRNSIRRNHTATHLLHWALRHVLGDHVKQAGSWVGPDRLRFDFSHYDAVTADEIAEIERLTNEETLRNERARAFETSKTEAEAMGAVAFFGDKYGDVVRVLEAGPSIELCGGTHVAATGDIGAVKVVSESSIGSNLRRIEAITGAASVELLQRDERQLAEIAQLVGTTGGVVEGVERKLDEIKALQGELKQLRSQLATGRASELAGTAADGIVVQRLDGLEPGDLRDLAIAVRQQPEVRRVVLMGETPTGGVSLVAAVQPDEGIAAADLIKTAARAVGGGGGGKGDIATAGGKDPSGLDEAMRIASEAATA